MGVAFSVTEDTVRTEPEPGQKRRGRPPGSGTGAKLETQLTQELTMVLKLTAMVWAKKDPVCAPVLNQQSNLIAADIAKYAAKKKWARKYLDKIGDFGELIPFLMHIQPVVMAIHMHHMTPQKEENEQEENVVAGPWSSAE
jgi:hypothetical protein